MTPPHLPEFMRWPPTGRVYHRDDLEVYAENGRWMVRVKAATS